MAWWEWTKVVLKAQQLKELEASFALATKEMQSAQAKMAVETAKEVFTRLRFSSIWIGNLQVNSDPKLKTKAEKDRRLKEKQAANTKKIIDERKSKGMKENKVRWNEKFPIIIHMDDHQKCDFAFLCLRILSNTKSNTLHTTENVIL